ncbi:MAG: ATP-binding protein [Actinomycetota bacterium]
MANQAPSRQFLPRHAETAVREALADTRVVVITGPRQAGKSTLARLVLAGDSQAKQLTLDDQLTLNAARSDPVGFVRHPGTMLVDEVQRAPELFLAIKAAVDRQNRPGQFLLTGSAQALSVPNLADALVGRMELVTLWPLSQGELNARKERFIHQLAEGNFSSNSSALTRSDYLDLAVAGGYPEAVLRPSRRARSRWFDSYLATMVGREVKNLVEIERLSELPRILRLLAARAATILNLQDLSNDAQIPSTTLRRYLALLETTFMIQRIPGWATSRTTRVLKAPKLVMVDSGLAAHLTDVGPGSFDRPGANPGPVLENFVLMELRKQLGWSDVRADLRHFRTKEGVEVDAVVEFADGRVAGVEVKSGATVRADDFKGLRLLATKAGPMFTCGVVLHSGSDAASFGEKLWALPISHLWQPPDR